MYALSSFFNKAFKLIFKISIILLLLLLAYWTFSYTMKSQQYPISLKIKITNKFEEEKGFIILNQTLKMDGIDKKIRVEFLDANNLTNNVFNISETDYKNVKEGQIYTAKFKGGQLKYIETDNKKSGS